MRARWPRWPGSRARPTWALRLWASMPHSSASPASSPEAVSTTEKHAASSDGPVATYGESAEPGGMGRQGRESARERVATSSYSSARSTGRSAS